MVGHYLYLPHCWKGDDSDSPWLPSDNPPLMWWGDHQSKGWVGCVARHKVVRAEVHDGYDPLFWHWDRLQASSIGNAWGLCLNG